ncbi:MAG: hypothetical protein ACRDRI_02535 [Pseudonocardiaceae bacterium]
MRTSAAAAGVRRRAGSARLAEGARITISPVVRCGGAALARFGAQAGRRFTRHYIVPRIFEGNV